MIRLARPSDHPQLKDLWMRVFGDSPEAVEEYFALRHKDDGMLVSESAGRIAAMLSMLPFSLVSGSASYPARYVYAVATDPPFRGQGIASDLLARAHELMIARGEAASVLVPASESLFQYYGQRGYQTAFRLTQREYRAGDLPAPPAGASAAALESAEYARLRDAAFSGSALYARWDAPSVSFARLGYELTLLTSPEGRAAALWEALPDGVLVRELALLGLDAKTALSILNSLAGADRYRVRLPGDAGIAQPFGMIRWLIPEPTLSGAQPYLALALD